jgi:hypothetical protein
MFKENVVPDTTNLRSLGTPTYRWNQFHVKNIISEDIRTTDIPSVNDLLDNLKRTIDWDPFFNATILRHNGVSFFQITQSGNFLPLQGNVRNLGSLSASFVGVHSNFFYGFLVGVSDLTLKKDVITNNKSGLDDIEALRVVDFTWKSNEKRDRGLIAQEAREVNPDFVVENEGLLHVASYPLILSLIKSVQELSERVRILEGRGV